MDTGFLSLKPPASPQDFVGREKQVRWLCRMIGSDRSECCAITGLAGSGKTSLLQFMAHRDGARQRMRTLSGEFLWADRFARFTEFVLVPMPSMGDWSPHSIQFAVARALETVVDFPTESAYSGGQSRDLEQMSLGALNQHIERQLKYFSDWTPPEARVAIGFDDADILLRKMGPELRNWYRHTATGPLADRLSFVLMLRQPIAALNRRFDASYFTNVFHEEYLGLLEEEEAWHLMRRAAGESADASEISFPGPQSLVGTSDASNTEPIGLNETDGYFLLREAGRHPDVLKAGCRLLLEAKSRAVGPCNGTENVRDDVALQLRLDGHVRGVFAELLKALQDQPALLNAAVRLVEQGVPRAEADTDERLDWITLRQLASFGIVDDMGPAPRLFSRAFEDYFRRHAPSHPEETTEAPRVGELIFLPTQSEVAVGGSRISLTSLESRLMDYLWRNSEQVCPKEEILEAVWGSDQSDAALEKAVNRLRKKLDSESEGRDYIMTVRGVGYMLRP